MQFGDEGVIQRSIQIHHLVCIAVEWDTRCHQIIGATRAIVEVPVGNDQLHQVTFSGVWTLRPRKSQYPEMLEHGETVGAIVSA